MVMKITSVYSEYCESLEENMPSSKSTPKNDCLDLKYDIGILNIMFLCVWNNFQTKYFITINL